jgi:hypothetical protein
VTQKPGQDPTGLSSIAKQTISHPHPLPDRRTLGTSIGARQPP